MRMNKFINKYHLQPGDEVVLPKSIFNLVQHYAIYIGRNAYGVDEFIENKIGQGVVITPANEFFPADGKLTRINRFKGSPYEREIAIRKAKSFIGKPYNAVVFNCEHFTNHVRTGKARSKQIENMVWLLAGVLLLRHLLSDNNSQNR